MPVVAIAVIIPLCGSFHSTMRLKESQAVANGFLNA